MSVRPESWLEQLFATPLQVRLLRLLYRDPRKYWTEREAAAAIKAPAPSARKVFRRLEEMGILEVRQVGRAHLVRPRPAMGLSDEIERAFRRESKTLDRILDAAKATLPAKVSLYLFGSTARGTAEPGSDLDLLVSGLDPATTQEAADEVRAAVRGYAPVPTNVVAIPRPDLRKPRYRSLTKNVLAQGRWLAGPDLKEVLR
ncbi:MAG: nucleotidyltransferase domain-containing protein [Euryarchaeota archaeon]|nr:nucleotidyltransferase domain-containing protein [Euryarchaeota archaeon]